jgi:hypothetical protein
MAEDFHSPGFPVEHVVLDLVAFPLIEGNANQRDQQNGTQRHPNG